MIEKETRLKFGGLKREIIEFLRLPIEFNLSDYGINEDDINFENLSLTLQILEEIIKTNNSFTPNWNTYGYFHRSRNKVLKEYLEFFKPILKEKKIISKEIENDIEKIRQILKYRGREDLSRLLFQSHSNVRESSSFGSRLHSIISTFEIYSPIEYTEKLRELKEEDNALILNAVKELYPLRDNAPEIIDIEYCISFNKEKRDYSFMESSISTQDKNFIESQDISTDFNMKDIEVLRGGDWKIEGNQSIFYYKVKIKNNSKLVINNIQILLTQTPAGLLVKKDRSKINLLKPNSFESPTFKLIATQSCVGDSIEGMVTYMDPSGRTRSSFIEPFKICYVCNLLIPKQISKQEFDQKTQFMEDQKLIIESDIDIINLESEIENIIKRCNFKLLQEIHAIQNDNFKLIEAYAQGLYDKQDVALSVALNKVGDSSEIIIKAMSDKTEKITEILRDFSEKLDDIKSDTELIKEYTLQIEQIFDKVDDLEAYLVDHLASDWEKIKDAYKDYKEGRINRKQFIGICIKLIGKRFIKRIIEKVSPI